VRTADSKSTTSDKALVSDEETAIVLAQPARFASEETMHGFRVYLAHRVAQITDMAQEYVNILGAVRRFQAFNAQFEARHERVVMWRDNYHARHTFLAGGQVGRKSELRLCFKEYITSEKIRGEVRYFHSKIRRPIFFLGVFFKYR